MALQLIDYSTHTRLKLVYSASCWRSAELRPGTSPRLCRGGIELRISRHLFSSSVEFPSICKSLIWAESNKYALIFRSKTRVNEGGLTAIFAIIGLNGNGRLFDEHGDIRACFKSRFYWSFSKKMAADKTCVIYFTCDSRRGRAASLIMEKK